MTSSNSFPSTAGRCTEQSSPIRENGALGRVLAICKELNRKQGVHSVISMSSAGFRYTGSADTVHCNACGLEISGWTLKMKPFAIHAQRSPTCPFVCSIRPTQQTAVSAVISLPLLSVDDNPSKRQKIEVPHQIGQANVLAEVDKLIQIRKRTFSHWPHRVSPSSAQMIEAGFFHCNVGDRVMCLYCKIICQQWTPNTDNPLEVHKTLSPKCPYVIAMIKRQQTAPGIRIVNELTTRDNITASTSDDLFRCQEIARTTACHTDYVEIPRRHASFVTWPNENLPSVNDLVRAGFFYTGTKTTVTCFYCNGSLQNWGANDNPTVEHARWFPQCAYAKQLCGAELYRKIQESKRAQQERAVDQDASSRVGSGDSSSSRGQLNIPDESTLSSFVDARLALPISQRLLKQNYKMSVIRRCWADQLRLKQEDFSSDSDLLMACIILQKQIEHIDGKIENIIIPSEAMNKIREKEQSENHPRAALLGELSSNRNSTRATLVQDISREVNASNQQNHQSSVNFCGQCRTDKKCLACMPCGHLAACVPCSRSLRSCPTCQKEIEAFVHIII